MSLSLTNFTAVTAHTSWRRTRVSLPLAYAFSIQHETPWGALPSAAVLASEERECTGWCWGPSSAGHRGHTHDVWSKRHLPFGCPKRQANKSLTLVPLCLLSGQISFIYVVSWLLLCLHDTCLEVRGQFCGVLCLFLPVQKFWGCDSGWQAYVAVPM